MQAILDANCVKCHGLIERKGGLELDSPEAVLRGGDGGPVVVRGRPDQSPLYTFLSPDSDPHMPPQKQLSDAQRKVIGDWIVALKTRTGGAKDKPKPPRQFDSVTRAIDTLLAEAWQAPPTGRARR